MKEKDCEPLYEKDFDELGENEGPGPVCCGKNMVYAPSEIVFVCLNCGAEHYTSS